jgi:hypothetical protein
VRVIGAASGCRWQGAGMRVRCRHVSVISASSRRLRADQRLTQPTVIVPNTDWAYGKQYQVIVCLFQGQTMHISLDAAK